MDTSFVKNPKLNTINTSLKPTRFKEVVALVHFGRSGSGLLYSLIDGHLEISTMPSIYFSEFFDHFAWENLIAEGFDGILNRFMSIYDILFNASSLTPIKTQGGKFVKNLGQQEGLLNVGDDKNEVLQLDRLAFRKELSRLLDEHNQIDAFTFFKLIQASFDKALRDINEKKLMFYHIHNPSADARLNFFRFAPNAKWIMMVREPLQSCESWIKNQFL